jgi:hypothetical protein
MSKRQKPVEFEWVLAPGEYNPLSCAPYCSPKKSIRLWRRAKVTESIVLRPANQSRQLVEEWLAQLIRRELGCALDAALKKNRQEKLELELGVVAATVIYDALAIRMKRTAKPSKPPGRTTA